MERCLFNRISVCQHGFIVERSCVTQLVEVLDQIGTKLDYICGHVKSLWHSKPRETPKEATSIWFWGEHAKMARIVPAQSIPVSDYIWFNIKPLTCDFRGPTGSTLGPMLFLLYVNSWPDAVRSSQIAAFADDAKIFKEITSTRDSEQLQEDLFNLVTRSDSASLNFNYRKCKAQPITRTLKPVIFVYHMAGSQLEVVCAEKDLVVYITDNLTWNKQVNVQCAKASRLLGYVRRTTRLIKSITVRRWAYLILVRSHPGYATQVWTPQSIDLIGKLECVQRRATKYILDLPFICDQTYGDRLMNFKSLPISCWHKFLDMIFFFKVVTGTVRISPSVLPQVMVTLTTRSESKRNVTHFISRKWNIVTFQRSFFNRTTKIWNTLTNDLQLWCNFQISQFKSVMYKYYVDALKRNYDPENPRSWKTISPSCNVSRNVFVRVCCCF